jgi:hypothetical protein
MLIKILVDEADADLWASIFENAENGMADASLQDMVENFGKEADEKLEALIDAYGMEKAFRIESYWRDKNEFEFIIISPDSSHKRDFIDMVKSCGASNISEGKDFDW